MDDSLTRLSSDLIHSLLFHERMASGLDGVFRDLGWVHLFTASGIHLLALFFWLDLLIRKFGQWRRLPIRWVRGFILVSFLWVAFLAWKTEGFHPSLFRPLLTVLLRKGFSMAGFRTPILFPVLLVFGFEWAISLQTGMPPGAIHYYLAVGGSLLALARSEKNRSGFRLHLEMAVFSWVPIGILDAIRDHQVAPFTPFFSLLSIPPVSLVLYPITLLVWAGMHSIPDFLLQVWCVYLKFLIFIADSLPTIVSVRPEILFLSIFGVLGFQMSIRSRTGRWLSVMAWVVVIRFFLDSEFPSRFIQLDVGQGDSAVLKRPDRLELVDLGSARVITPDRMFRSFSRFGITHVDGVLFSHLDEDHIGALPILLALFPVGCIEIGAHHQEDPRGQRILEWIRGHHPGVPIQASGCIQNARVAWFESHRGGAKGNEWMAGLASSWQDHLYLALGDGDQMQEHDFLREFKSEIESHSHRIWKVGHHGSRFSSNGEFLRSIHAEEFWISVGRKNHYHHPSPEALARLALLPGRVRRTDQEGDLESGSLE
jgi:competence protein ComEC